MVSAFQPLLGVMGALCHQRGNRGVRLDISALVLVSRQDALQRQMDVAANNIANATTVGFKQQQNIFQTYLAKSFGGDPVHYVIDKGTAIDFRNGPLTQTGNALDVAVDGEGLMPVQTPQGVAYTRAGSFTLDDQGHIITSAGYPVLSNGGAPIIVPTEARHITITGNGSIRTEAGEIGRLGVVTFARPQEVTLSGEGLYRTTQAGVANENARFVQGALEQSNVQPVVELTRVMEVSRAYQQTARLIDQDFERQRNAIRALGRTTAA
ncbi:MAG: flagellar basal-body rod protein FlgF [Alphaproteobacteria bacterium]|nr:flagellar basal-body rod protein FlgF [Alphaproteobacteria bacterium]